MTEEQSRKHHTRKMISYLSLFILSLLITGSLFLPIPYYIEAPGSAEDVQQLITVDGQTNDHLGAYLMTTVGFKKATPVSYLLAMNSEFRDVVSDKELQGEGTSEEFDKLSDLQMVSSENMAKKVALDLAKEPYDIIYKGIYVLNVMDHSDFKNKLVVGDLVYQIDELKFKTTEKMTDYIRGKKKGDQVTLKFEREGEQLSATGKLTKFEDQETVGIGISLAEENELKSEKSIDFNVQGVGGPSAGLMFTLEIYEGLTKKSYRKGHVIAGTGQINSQGEVEMIGGIDKKIVAADRAGAEIFFAPSQEFSKEEKKESPDLKNNYEVAVETAKKIKTDMKIVPVRDVKDAITYMNKLPVKDSE